MVDDDVERMNSIARTIKPTEYAYNPEDHQKRIFELAARLTSALDEAKIPYKTEGSLIKTSECNRLEYNANVTANIKANPDG